MSVLAERDLWAIVLAGGDGKRLAPLTRALYGRELPKQFAAITGRMSMLQVTVERIGALVPTHRTVVVVGQAHATVARAQLAGHPGIDIVVQPVNLDTAPGILLPLARILARDPDARVAVFPSDHYVPNPAPLLRAVEEAASASRRLRRLVTLLGVVPDRPETEYGWMLPGSRVTARPLGSIRRVHRFVEKPPAEEAERLLERGGLWNTFVSVGRASAYRALAARHVPVHTALFELYLRSVGGSNEERVLRSVYSVMPPANFSRDVLERAAGLALIPVNGSGWSDWGSPERVLRSIEGTSMHAALAARFAAAAPPRVASGLP